LTETLGRFRTLRQAVAVQFPRRHVRQPGFVQQTSHFVGVGRLQVQLAGVFLLALLAAAEPRFFAERGFRLAHVG